MSVKIGRNEPCPCGSGKKFKKCCSASLEPAAFGHEDRWAALDRLDGFMDQFPEDAGDAFREFWGERAERDLALDETVDAISSSVLDGWVFFDRPFADGRLMVDALLEQDDSIGPGERAYLQAMRQSSLHVWEVESVVPGVSLTLRDVLENHSIIVRERRLSQELERSEWLAARVIPRGPSGGPEIELGVLDIPRLLQLSLREELVLRRSKFLTDNPDHDSEEFYKSLPPLLHDSWIGTILEPATHQDLTQRVRDVIRERALGGEADSPG